MRILALGRSKIYYCENDGHRYSIFSLIIEQFVMDKFIGINSWYQFIRQMQLFVLDEILLPKNKARDSGIACECDL